ncbi:MAG: phosphate-binding protein [Syntrophobacteraceae bacterium CG2_30_61_12]|nr:MAG: phosphate-binding protein [Syntrophobacteraceae bacterium CG2_30_61_12]PIU32911.1 MAG: phosphate-binding protein [Syntrophobacteraceae bacterium CG07_land_8_20_14_0_80_61_8]
MGKMMQVVGIVGCFLLLGQDLAGAGDFAVFAGKEGAIKISGGTAHIPVMREVAERIMTLNPKVRITIAGGGSGVGIKQVGEGLVDIGNSGRKPTAEEIAAFNLKLFQWALDGVAVVVHPKNPVKALGSDQVRAIFAGKVSNWKDLGGPDQAIHVFSREETSGTREVFWTLALSKGEVSQAADVVPSNGAMKTAVAGDPAAVGYMSVGYVDQSVAAVVLDGVEPSIDNVRRGIYPVARGLFSNTKGEPGPLVKAFLDLLFAPEGQAIIQAKGFIPTGK